MLHPSLEAAAELLNSHFLKYCVSQDLLSSRYPDRVQWVLQHLPSDMADERKKLLEQWTTNKANSADSTAKRWNTLKCFLQEEGRNNAVKDIILSTVYPRLDSNVTHGRFFILSKAS